MTMRVDDQREHVRNRGRDLHASADRVRAGIF
jgi:hypothetical protein